MIFALPILSAEAIPQQQNMETIIFRLKQDHDTDKDRVVILL